jgi:Arc/MetJ family transcription regulator
VRWKGVTYLEDGLHRAVRAALRNRTVLHARVFDMDMPLGQPG